MWQSPVNYIESCFIFICLRYFNSFLISLLTHRFFSEACLVSTCSFFHLFSSVDATVGKILDMNSIPLYLLRLISWPSRWSILGNIPCALQKKLKFCFVRWYDLWISIKSNWSIISFKVMIDLLIFLTVLYFFFLDVTGLLVSFCYQSLSSCLLICLLIFALYVVYV